MQKIYAFIFSAKPRIPLRFLIYDFYERSLDLF